MQPAVREALGRVVRETWVTWAKEQERHQGDIFPTWDEMAEADKEGDRRIAEAVVAQLVAWLPPALHNLLPEVEVTHLRRGLESDEH